ANWVESACQAAQLALHSSPCMTRPNGFHNIAVDSTAQPSLVLNQTGYFDLRVRNRPPSARVLPCDRSRRPGDNQTMLPETTLCRSRLLPSRAPRARVRGPHNRQADPRGHLADEALSRLGTALRQAGGRERSHRTDPVRLQGRAGCYWPTTRASWTSASRLPNTSCWTRGIRRRSKSAWPNSRTCTTNSSTRRAPRLIPASSRPSRCDVRWTEHSRSPVVTNCPSTDPHQNDHLYLGGRSPPF